MKRFSRSAVLAALAIVSLLIFQRSDVPRVLAQECDGVLVRHEEMLVTAELEPGVFGPAPILHGDLNADGTRDLSDAVSLLSYLFLGGPEPPPLVAVECEPDLEGDASVRFYSEVTCSGGGFTATLNLTSCGADPLPTTTGNWSTCITIPPVDCRPCIQASTTCGNINICDDLNMRPGRVYSLVLYFNGVAPAAMLFEEPGDCSTPVPTPDGKDSMEKALRDGRAVIFGVADGDLQGFDGMH
ncbi:MAG: hypothetical protein JXA90_08275 [Planctomycetes bacterium]|nr:hypothetical protein [Planctomycetota bacterium]